MTLVDVYVLDYQGSSNINFRFQSLVNRAVFGNLEQPAFLGFVQVAGQFDCAIDAVEKTLLRFAVPAIFSMNAVVLEPDCDVLQIHAFTLRVQSQCHRHARTRD